MWHHQWLVSTDNIFLASAKPVMRCSSCDITSDCGQYWHYISHFSKTSDTLVHGANITLFMTVVSTHTVFSTSVFYFSCDIIRDWRQYWHYFFSPRRSEWCVNAHVTSSVTLSSSTSRLISWLCGMSDVFGKNRSSKLHGVFPLSSDVIWRKKTWRKIGCQQFEE